MHTSGLAPLPALIINGDHNYITNSSAPALPGDGIVIAGNYNIVETNGVTRGGVPTTNGIEIDAASNHNTIENNSVTAVGNGIEVDAGSNYNTIEDNSVTAVGIGSFAFFDGNPNCGKDTWTGNTFNLFFGAESSSQSCID